MQGIPLSTNNTHTSPTPSATCTTTAHNPHTPISNDTTHPISWRTADRSEIEPHSLSWALALPSAPHHLQSRSPHNRRLNISPNRGSRYNAGCPRKLSYLYPLNHTTTCSRRCGPCFLM